MSTRLFTSDLHIGHALVSRARGFTSVGEHDEEVVRRWNAEVRPEDTVFVAGDAVMGDRRKNLRLLARMNGTKHLIAGNHDDCWPGHSNSWAKQALYQEVFASVQPFLRLTIDRRIVLISHFPYTADRTDPPRYNQYRLRDEGELLLHGHTQSSARRTSPREIHIGMDAWDLTPVAECRIIGMIRTQLAREEEEGHAELSYPADDEGAPAESPSHGGPDEGPGAGA